MKFKITSPIIEPTEGSPHRASATLLDTLQPRLFPLLHALLARFLPAHPSYYRSYNFISH
ncbi:hypothetical protein [Vibrio sp. 99-70-13A1]|uniref:hypothetical protein n=1 Tax=Vibrio sp. 99-70-13A1 TaxID=2607601 RepID=UPI001493C04A|nr:hypothetical protein [Vibrio sp. 99-70-13A1]NOH96889.1 hypothetical protein [Vibrio sp. 99-70-13A1]